MLSFTIDRHTTISDILDDFNGYYSYASGQPFKPKRSRGNTHRRSEEIVCYNASKRNSEDFHPSTSSPLEVSGLNLYSDD